jgi:hypothetical protein
MTLVNGEQIDLISLETALREAGAVLTVPTVNLIIENGTLVANANSYVTLQEIVDYATRRNVSLGANSDVIIRQLIIATDYIDGREQAFQGKRVSSTQSLCWPRTDVCLFDEDILDTVIPSRLKRAQMELVLAQAQGVTLLPVGTRANIKRERISNNVEIEFFNSTATPSLPMVDKWLQPLYISRGLGLAVVRG